MRVIKSIFAGLLCLSLVGCGNNKSEVQFNTQEKAEKSTKKQKKQIKKLEKTRLATDATAWKTLTEDYNNLKEEYEESKDKSIALLIEYYSGIYNIAYARIQNDSDYYGAYDDGYTEYLALLQTFCEYYESDLQTFYDQLDSGDANVLGSNLFVAEKAVENLYNAYLTDGKLTKSSDNNSASSSKTKKKSKSKSKEKDKKSKSKKKKKSSKN